MPFEKIHISWCFVFLLTTLLLFSPSSIAAESGDIVVSEIAWMGTQASYSDEWLELYNRTGTKIDIRGWSIYGLNSGACINVSEADSVSSTVVEPYDFLIYGNDENVVNNDNGESLVDIWDAAVSLNNSSPGKIILYDSGDCTGNVIDETNKSEGDWFAGDSNDDVTMERVNSCSSGAEAGNWKNNTGDKLRGRDAEGNTINGTPGMKNSVQENEPPVAKITGPNEAEAGNSFQLSAEGCSDCNGYIESYRWDLDGDGEYDDARGDTTGLSFSEEGRYRVNLKTIDDEGASDTVTQEIKVNPGKLAEITLNSSAQAVEVSDSSSVKIVTTAKDRYGNLKPGVTLSVTTESGNLSSDSITTAGDGQASVELTGVKGETACTVMATSGGLSGATTVFFQKPGVPDFESSTTIVAGSGDRRATLVQKTEQRVKVEAEKIKSEVEKKVAITFARYKSNPKDESGLNTGSGGYFNINATHPGAIEELTVKLYLDPWPNEPLIKYWDSNSMKWTRFSKMELHQDSGFVKVTIAPDSKPASAKLSGLQLAAGSLDTEYIQVEKAGWTMVSAPLEPANKAPTEVFKGVDKDEFFHWNPDKGGYDTRADDYKVSPFHGAWIYLEETQVPKVFTIPGVYSGNVTITLENPGWHQVGSPLDYSWSYIGVTKEGKETMTVAAQASGPSAPHWMSRFIWDYDAESGEYSAYQPTDTGFTMEPGKAYWVKTYEPNVKLKIPHAAPPPVPSSTKPNQQAKGIPMDSAKAEKLDVPQPPSPPETYSVGQFDIQVTPNPVTSNDRVTFIAAGSNLDSFQVNVYNSSGNQIHASRRQSDHTYAWKPEGNLSNGIYLYQVTANKDNGKVVTETGKLLMLK